MRTVVFDLDGTLADTSGDLLAAANACFRQMGEGDVLRAETDAGTALRGGRAMLTLGLERLGRSVDAATLDHWYPVLLEAYRAEIDTHTVLYPHAMEMVQALKAGGSRVAVCTNKPEALALLLLDRLGVLSEFDAMLGADTLPVRKPDPAHYVETVRRAGGDVARSLLVGDTVTDRKTAQAAQVPCILVTFGPAGGDMAALAPAALMQDYRELPELVDQLIGRA